MFHGQAGSAWSGFGATAPEGLKLAFFCQFPLILMFSRGDLLILDPKRTSFVKSLFSVLSTNLTYVDEERWCCLTSLEALQ